MSPSSPCTGPAARTAPSRSCSRSSASPTPAPASPPAGAAPTRSSPSTSSAPPASRRPTGFAFNATAFGELGAADALEEIEERLGFPLVVKPAGPGLGARGPLRRRPRPGPGALVAAFSYGDRVLLERYVDGRELAVSVIDGEALPAVEAIPHADDDLRLRGPLRDRPHRVRLPAAARARRGGERRRAGDRRLRGARLCRCCPGRPDARRRRPPGARGQRDPRPHRHQPAADGGRGRGHELRGAGRADPRSSSPSVTAGSRGRSTSSRRRRSPRARRCRGSP